jgi:DNA-binding MarR family transcriptional regulator
MTERFRLKLDDHAVLLAFIVAFTARHGAPPSQRQIAIFLGLTVAGAHYRVVNLERKGYVTRLNGRRARCITLTERGRILITKYRQGEGEAL